MVDHALNRRGVGVFHATARLRFGAPSLIAPPIGRWLWGAMREAFPSVVGACLMPDHPHVLVLAEDGERVRHRLNRVLGSVARRFSLGRALADAAVTAPLTDTSKVLRNIRYVALNPTRAGFVRDPLAWEFSTHRDIVGAVADPWVTAHALAPWIGRVPEGLGDWLHEYVSADPSVSVGGTPVPLPANPTAWSTIPLGVIATAAVAATRTTMDALTRRGPTRTLLVRLALEQGWTRRAQLADATGCTVRTIYNLANTNDAALLHAGRLCLGDERLRSAFTRLQFHGRGNPSAPSDARRLTFRVLENSRPLPARQR